MAVEVHRKRAKRSPAEAVEVGVEVRVAKRLSDPKNELWDSGLGPAPGATNSSTPSTDYDSEVPQVPTAPEHHVGPA